MEGWDFIMLVGRKQYSGLFFAYRQNLPKTDL